MKDARDIIYKPLVTEKATRLMEQNKYVFIVDKRANKLRSAKQWKIFSVSRLSLLIRKMSAESLKSRDSQGIQTGSEKAIVTLKEGSKPIELFE